MLEVPIQSLISKERMDGGPRKNPSLDIMNASQVSIPATRMTFQETPLMGMCLINMRERRKPKNIQGKAITTTLNALQLLFWPHLCGEGF